MEEMGHGTSRHGYQMKTPMKRQRNLSNGIQLVPVPELEYISPRFGPRLLSSSKQHMGGRAAMEGIGCSRRGSPIARLDRNSPPSYQEPPLSLSTV